ncbi:MAG: FAD-dependent oxidoreductase [Caulobacteraceae bacterium]
MNRRRLLGSTLSAAALAPVAADALAPPLTGRSANRRPRPGDAAWPDASEWARLANSIDQRLIPVRSPLAAACADPTPGSCNRLFAAVKNPFFIGDQPGLTQTLGWVGGWTSKPSAYAVLAQETRDVVAAVDFARQHNLRLVVKGGGHSYQGASNAADSLLVWTRGMNGAVAHEAFVAEGCEDARSPQPAVTLGAGAIWGRVYQAVTTLGGRYVQGGGCTTVGVAGLVQSGGFGSFSKRYGCAAAGLLEAEIITADGVVRTVNPRLHADLFWAIKGGGGGTFGVVTKVTLRTRELPSVLGGVNATIHAKSDDAYRRLIEEVVRFYRSTLFNPHWGEQIFFIPGNSMWIRMTFQGLTGEEARGVWRPFFAWVTRHDHDFDMAAPRVDALPGQRFWDAGALSREPGVIVGDDRPGASPTDFIWAGDQGEAGQYLEGFQSAWLRQSLLKPDQQPRLCAALFQATRSWWISLQFNKGLAGSPVEAIEGARDTAINPVVLDAFALAISSSAEQRAYPGVAGHEPDVAAARRNAAAIDLAMGELRAIGAEGAYVSESDYFLRGWGEAFWGSNYPRLARVKATYDPDGLFFVHHGVGSEGWSDDGFERRF